MGEVFKFPNAQRPEGRRKDIPVNASEIPASEVHRFPERAPTSPMEKLIKLRQYVARHDAGQRDYEEQDPRPKIVRTLHRLTIGPTKKIQPQHMAKLSDDTLLTIAEQIFEAGEGYWEQSIDQIRAIDDVLTERKSERENITPREE